MPDVADGQITQLAAAERGGHSRPPAAPPLRTGVDEAPARRSNDFPFAPSRRSTDYEEVAARRSLKNQIAKLERELGAVFATAYPRRGLEWQVASPGGPRVLGIGELEEVRDALAARLEDARRTLRDRAYVERKNLDRIDEMVAEPARFKWVRISNADIGEPGCKYWHSRPRFGLVGMLLGWWRVKISSGCP
jgi:hypothetical protein